MIAFCHVYIFFFFFENHNIIYQLTGHNFVYFFLFYKKKVSLKLLDSASLASARSGFAHVAQGVIITPNFDYHIGKVLTCILASVSLVRWANSSLV